MRVPASSAHIAFTDTRKHGWRRANLLVHFPSCGALHVFGLSSPSPPRVFRRLVSYVGRVGLGVRVHAPAFTTPPSMAAYRRVRSTCVCALLTSVTLQRAFLPTSFLSLSSLSPALLPTRDGPFALAFLFTGGLAESKQLDLPIHAFHRAQPNPRISAALRCFSLLPNSTSSAHVTANPMARSRAAPRASGGSSHHAAASPPPKKAEPLHQSTPHAHPQQPNGVTNIYVQRPMAGGGGGGILGTMAAVAGGSVLGHGISNYLYGHSNQAPTQPAEAQQLAQAAQQEGHVCTPQLVGYSKCLEANPESADSCKWAWDYFTQCQREHPMQPPQ